MLAVVLNDEKTYSTVDGALLVEVHADYLREHDAYEGDGRIITEFVLEPPYLELEDEESSADRMFVVVLADGESVGSLRGCIIVELDDDYSADEPVADGIVITEF